MLDPKKKSPERDRPPAVATEREIGPAISAQSDVSEKQTSPSRAAQQADAAKTTYAARTLHFNDQRDGLDSIPDEEYFTAEEDLETDALSAVQMGQGVKKSAAGISNTVSHGTTIQRAGSNKDQGQDVVDFRNLNGGTGGGRPGTGHGAPMQGERFFGGRGRGGSDLRSLNFRNYGKLGGGKPGAGHGSAILGEGFFEDQGRAVLGLRKAEVRNGDATSGRPAAATEQQQADTANVVSRIKRLNLHKSGARSSNGRFDSSAKKTREFEATALRAAQAAPSAAMPTARISNTADHGAAVPREGLKKDQGPSIRNLRNHPYLTIGEAASGRPEADTQGQQTGVAKTTHEKNTDRYESLAPSSDDEYGSWGITEEEAQELEAKAVAQAHRGDAGPADSISNRPKREAVVYALAEMANHPSSGLETAIKSSTLGTYGNRENERNRLGIGPAGNFEAEHILPYNALHKGIPRKSNRALEKKMPAYLEVKEYHRNHPATGNTGTDRVEGGWPTGDSCRTDMRAMLFDPVARTQGTSVSNIYQINQLGYAHVFAEMGRQSDDPLGATYQMRVATVSYNHTVKSNPAIQLSGGAQSNETLRLDPKGQALAVLAREAATKGKWPSHERMLEVYDHFLDQHKVQQTSAASQAPQSAMNGADRLNSAGEPNAPEVNRSSREAASRERSSERERSRIRSR